MKTQDPYDALIIGGGAAGFFAAIACAERNPGARVAILEKGREVLQKVKVSGGGRCNVTHACFDPRELVKNYPRGGSALLGPFHSFGPSETVEWFQQRGVRLKTEADGRMFPSTDRSQTIMDCLLRAAEAAGVQVLTGQNVTEIVPPFVPPDSSPTANEPPPNWGSAAHWLLKTQGGDTFFSEKIMLAAGSSPRIWEMLATLGHRIVPPVPSLFTFNIRDQRIAGLEGLSVPHAVAKVQGSKLCTEGPLLVTHWGLSGPAILKLSAWGARGLHECGYRFTVEINWLGKTSLPGTEDFLKVEKTRSTRKTVEANNPFVTLPKRLWQRLVASAGIGMELRWADLNKEQTRHLAQQLAACAFSVDGKSTYKSEFVTAGGVHLDEVNFKTFESKLLPRLFLAGEVLDIDAVTGGFNFQAAWTGGWIAGQSL